MSVDTRGLCDNCSPEVDRLVHNAVVASGAADRAKTLETRLKSLELFEQFCIALKPYEQRGISTLGTKPSHILNRIGDWREAFAAEEARRLSELARGKLASGGTAAAKSSGYVTSINTLTKLALQYPENRALRAGIEELSSELSNTRFELALQKAETELAKGKTARAADVVIEAAMSLRHDNTPDDQQTGQLQRAREFLRLLGREAPF